MAERAYEWNAFTAEIAGNKLGGITMKKLWILISGLILVFGIISMNHSPSQADTGHEGATRIENGENLTTSQIAISSTGPALILAAGLNRACVKVRNIGGDRISISSSSSVTLANGFVIGTTTEPATSTLELGNYTGALWGYRFSNPVSSGSISLGICSTTAP